VAVASKLQSGGISIDECNAKKQRTSPNVHDEEKRREGRCVQDQVA